MDLDVDDLRGPIPNDLTPENSDYESFLRRQEYQTNRIDEPKNSTLQQEGELNTTVRHDMICYWKRKM